jgi:hypothetical protein
VVISTPTFQNPHHVLSSIAACLCFAFRFAPNAMVLNGLAGKTPRNF